MVNKKKRIMIIGHSRGLGKHLMSFFEERKYFVNGFSRSNGYDLQKSEIQSKLIEKSFSFDVVLLCVRAGFVESEFLFKLHQCWREKKYHNHIVTIGSKASVDYQTRLDSHLLYFYEKISLEKLSESLSLYKPIRVSHLNLDFLETEAILKNKNYSNESKISLEYVGTSIEWIVEAPLTVCVSKVNLWAR